MLVVLVQMPLFWLGAIALRSQFQLSRPLSVVVVVAYAVVLMVVLVVILYRFSSEEDRRQMRDFRMRRDRP